MAFALNFVLRTILWFVTFILVDKLLVKVWNVLKATKPWQLKKA